MTPNKFIVEYTTRDIMDKLNTMDGKIDKVHVETRKTNGRVSRLEAEVGRISKHSIGEWIREHPAKFAMFCIIILAFLIGIQNSETIGWITSLV